MGRHCQRFGRITAGLTLFSLAGHSCLGVVYSSLQDTRVFGFVCWVGFALAGGICASCAAAGYYAYGSKLQASFIDNIGTTLEGDIIGVLLPLRRFASIAVIVKLQGVFPIMYTPVLASVYMVTGARSGLQREVAKVVLVAATCSAALAFPDSSFPLRLGRCARLHCTQRGQSLHGSLVHGALASGPPVALGSPRAGEGADTNERSPEVLACASRHQQEFAEPDT